MHYWTICRKQEVLNPDSDCAKLLQRFPTPTIYDEKAYVFVDYLPEQEESIIVELTEDNSLEEIAQQIETYLDNNNVRSVLLSKGLASQLFRLLVPPIDEP